MAAATGTHGKEGRRRNFHIEEEQEPGLRNSGDFSGDAPGEESTVQEEGSSFSLGASLTSLLEQLGVS